MPENKDEKPIIIDEESADMDVDEGESESTDQKCPECGGDMVKEMDRHQSYIYTCVKCGYTESE